MQFDNLIFIDMETINTIPKTAYITIDNNYVLLHVDINGNLYFNFNEKMYQLNIDENDNPILEIGEYNIMDDIKIYTKGKIIKSEKFENDDYFQEDNGHDLIDENNDYYDEYEDIDETPFFKFYDSESKIDIHNRENGHILALYDIFLYDNISQPEQEKLIFQSKLQNEISIYRVALYTNGKFFFRPIGCAKEKKYILMIIDQILRIQS